MSAGGVVARELGATGDATGASRAARAEGIDYEGLPPSLAAAAIEPGDDAYAEKRSSAMRAGWPGLILPVRTAGEVSDALAFARRQGVALSVRSGGHGLSGRSTNDGGIVIDLSPMNGIEVLDPAARRVRIEPGAIFAEVAAVLAAHGWALSSGDYGGVGVGGLATGGGIGWLVREHGLTIDHLRGADIVLADGTHVHASDGENAELFWGLRGAGANFGVVTAFEFEVDEVGPVGFAQLAFDAEDLPALLLRWNEVMADAPRDLTTSLIIGPPRIGRPQIAQLSAVVDSADPNVVRERVQRVAEIAPVLDVQARITEYAELMRAYPGSHVGRGEPAVRSGLVEEISEQFATAAARLLATGVVFFFQMRSMGGAVADIPADATAFAHRSARFQLNAFGTDRARLDALWDDVYHHLSGLYLNFETDQGAQRLHDAFPPRTLQRLRLLKTQVDPDNVFRDNFNIAPQLYGAAAHARPSHTSRRRTP
jgi:FAD/FMN-containing dehydrogenase